MLSLNMQHYSTSTTSIHLRMLMRMLRVLQTWRFWVFVYVCLCVLLLQHLVSLYVSFTSHTSPLLDDLRKRTQEHSDDHVFSPHRRMVDSALSVLQRAQQGLPPHGARLVDQHRYSRHCQVYDVTTSHMGTQGGEEQWRPRAEEPAFRLYVYELPPKFNVDLVSCIERRFYKERCFNVDFCGAGVRLGNTTRNMYTHDTWQFSLEVLLHHKLLFSPYRTLNASEADLFYVPYYSALDCYCSAAEKTPNKPSSQVSQLFLYLKQTGQFLPKQAKPHMMALGKIQREHFTPTCPLLRHPDAGHFIFAGIEEESSSYRKPLRRSIGRRPMVVVPYPSYAHLNTFSISVPHTTRLKSVRAVLLFLAAGQRRSNPFRAGILDQFKRHSTTSSYSTVMGKAGYHDAGFIQRDKVWLITNECRGDHKYHTLTWMQHSVFCLQPPGDSPTRKSFYDAIHSGCIPVLFESPRHGKVRYPFSDRLQFDQFTVTIPQSNSADVLTFLRLIPKPAVQTLQEELQKVAQYLQYSLPIANLPHADAVQYMLDEVYQYHITA